MGLGIALYNHTKASAKAKEQAKALAKEDENHEANRLVIQIQDCTKGNSKDTLATSGTQYGTPSVSKAQAFKAVDLVTHDLRKTNKSMATSNEFQAASLKLKEKIIASAPLYEHKSQNSLQEIFIYKGKKYRIDLDSYVSKNNPPNLMLME